MFWPAVRRYQGRRTCAAGAAAALVLLVAAEGCARPAGPIFDPSGPSVVWPGPPEQPRIRLVGSISGSEDLNAGQSAGESFWQAVRGPRLPINFSSPHSVAPGPGNLLAIADVGLAGVHIVDLGSRSHVLVAGAEDQLFETPIGVCWAGRRLFVTDAGRHEVVELGPGGNFRKRFGTDVLSRPVGIAYVAGRDQLYVVDGDAHDIAVFDLSGRLVQRLARHGNGEGELNHPTHITWNGGEEIVVADTANFRVQWLDLDGRPRGIVGQKGDAAGDLALPKGVALDSEGHLYVVDARFENIQIFNRQGQLLLAFGEEGSGPGRFALPAGLAIDENDRIWVADSANHRIQVFDYLREVQ